MLGAFVVAFLFPFTQGGSDANMSIATQVIIFAATAMGLNIVVGLAGLLDLGYIAFLGAGAYTAAVLSDSAFATVGWQPPFLLVVLIGGCVSATLGLHHRNADPARLRGLPGHRHPGVRGDLPDHHGQPRRQQRAEPDQRAQRHPRHPGPRRLRLGLRRDAHRRRHPARPVRELLLPPADLSRFVITVFVRLNNSRIGRGWVAIREDEKAAEAMGVNVFGLKLFAFSSGAFLAGMAGTVKAHQDVSVTPDQYVFLNAAFLLAAIVLGGMGTVAGVLIGSAILRLLPEKLRFISDYRLLIFGLLLVIMMRFRPEGIIASQRRQLEFHEEDQELAERIEEELKETGEMREATR